MLEYVGCRNMTDGVVTDRLGTVSASDGATYSESGEEGHEIIFGPEPRNFFASR